MLDPERARGRRREDASAYSVGNGLLWVLKHWKIVSAAVVGALGGASGLAAWLGAQTSSPGQRVTRLEAKVDNGFDDVNARVDTLASRVERVDSMRIARDRENEEKVDLLLRLGCRQMRESDLLRACDRQGVRR